jgi:class 3 adenylate cyclase
MLKSLFKLYPQINIRSALPAIHVPTLVVHRKGDRVLPVEMARYLAEHISGAKYVELEGNDHFFFVGDVDGILDEIEEFLTGVRHGPDPGRALMTLLFTDIVESTEHAAQLGDRGWRELLDRHHALVRRQLIRFGGREVDTAGDGFFATFDGPARAVRCGQSIRDAVRALGIEIRAGLHTGECELAASQVRGIAVHIGARVAAAAGPGEILVSSTVKDLVVGSGLRFSDRGLCPLKGLQGEWHLYAVQDGGA